jgi:protein-tyrosine-phosphatase
MSDILVISTLNVCRGPMLEGFIRDRLRRLAPGSSVGSRGINVVAPSRALPQAQMTMKNEYGIDIGAHIARPLSLEDLRAAVAVFTVSDEHARYISTVYPDFGGKVQLAAERSVEPVDADDMTMFKLCAQHLKDRADAIDLAAVLGKQAGL